MMSNKTVVSSFVNNHVLTHVHIFKIWYEDYFLYDWEDSAILITNNECKNTKNSQSV